VTSPVILTPVTTDLAATFSPRIFRKQLLPFGSVTHKGQRLNFTPEFCKTLVDSFRGRAYDTVKFLLAGPNNEHTDDPERMRGTVRDLALSSTGLDAVIELSESAASLIADHPDLGVSARIVPNLVKSDGRTFPSAIKHVLGCIDPVVTGMAPWEAVDLSTEDPDLTVVDLSAETFTNPEATVPEITPEQSALLERLAAVPAEQLDALLAAPAAPTAPAAPAVPDNSRRSLLQRLRGEAAGTHRAADAPAAPAAPTAPAGDVEPTDAEVEAAIAALEADANAPAPAAASLSTE
jgi:hypothetical protein